VCAQRLSQIVFIAVVGIIKQTILKSPASFLSGSSDGGRVVAGSAGTAPPHPRVCDKGVVMG